jgi:uncharacterized membrane protein
MATVLRRNIEALAEVRREFERRKNRQDRIADAITRFTGSLTFELKRDVSPQPVVAEIERINKERP